MKINYRSKRSSKPALITFLLLVLFWPQQAEMQTQHPGNDSDLAYVYPTDTHPKTQSSLFQLMNVYMMQGMEKAQVFAQNNSIDMDDTGVRVVIETSSFGPVRNRLMSEYNVQHVSNLLSSSGAKLETSFNNLIQSRVPLEALVELKDYELIGRIRLPLIPQTCVVSEGVSRVGALEWQDVSPYKTDEEVKVCILDDGFTGYLSLLGSELPASVEARSFRADGNLFTNEHGTACAEIVHDIAPNAKLYLVNIGTDLEFLNAVEWLISEEVDIISCSLSWVNAGAGDGTGPINAVVGWAYANGIIWVNSGGNDADVHWMGTFSDTNSNGYHNFLGGDEIFSFNITGGNWYGVFVNWDDWGTWSDISFSYSGSDQDFDVELYRWNGSDWDYIGSSSNVHSGNQWTVEEIIGYVWPSGKYGIAIQKKNATRNVKFDIRFWGATSAREYNIPEESMGIPGDSANVIAVGATGLYNDSLHYYSSRGPTKDGTIKPDLTAPSGVSTVSYGNLQFYGTSPCAPLVAGACALLKEKTPLTQRQIIDTLEGRALDLGMPGKDNLFGSGRLKLNK